jgi:hypothetical protein
MRRSEFLQHVQQDILGSHMPDLTLELELLDDLLDIGAEAIEVVFEVGLSNLLTVGGGVAEPLQRPDAGVVEDVAACILEALCHPIR